jgi:hypothetical protein
MGLDKTVAEKLMGKLLDLGASMNAVATREYPDLDPDKVPSAELPR